MRAGAHILGPDVDEVIANLDLPIADFNAALANSLAQAINDATRVALFKARWLNGAMILAVVTILFLSLARHHQWCCRREVAHHSPSRRLPGVGPSFTTWPPSSMLGSRGAAGPIFASSRSAIDHTPISGSDPATNALSAS